MNREMPPAAILGAAVIVFLALVGAVYMFFLRPASIPEGKIDPTLPPPQVQANGRSRFGPRLDATGQTAPPSTEKAVLSAPSGD
ncbi:MAG: hypothetical protein SFU56_18110 [Capsulimonadales bacterium]|nr:hypothetical protein [Capsulimonadales bacterium]